jgi:hypothetical protein
MLHWVRWVEADLASVCLNKGEIMVFDVVETMYLGAAVKFALTESKVMPPKDQQFMKKLFERIMEEGSKEMDALPQAEQDRITTEFEGE